jgi:uncharacterized iron-regulated protein
MFIRAWSEAGVVLGLAFTFACAGGEAGRVSPSPQTGQVSGFAAGQIIETATGEPISLDRLMAIIGQQDIVYLGEEHHHRSHIENGLAILRNLKAQGRKPVLAMEMFGWDGQPALDRYLSDAALNRAEFLESVGWQTNWGGPFEDYEPLVQFAKEQSLAVDAINPPKALVRVVAKQGLAQAQADPIMAQWGMQGETLVDDPLYRTRILQQLQACHGGGADSLYRTMYEASMVRDEGMAKTIAARLNRLRSNLESMTGPVVSYTGGGHIQYNLPVPKRVVRRLGDEIRQVSIYMTSFDAGRIDEIQEMIRDHIADYVWLTPVSGQGLPRRC